tara:strand:- start:1893 stop:2054 length:162 start_codon:yes stop_codon:yes gene_type:complete
MNKNIHTRTGFIHLYNPKEEGIGSYDANYINAYNKNNRKKKEKYNKSNERYAA